MYPHRMIEPVERGDIGSRNGNTSAQVNHGARNFGPDQVQVYEYSCSTKKPQRSKIPQRCSIPRNSLGSTALNTSEPTVLTQCQKNKIPKEENVYISRCTKPERKTWTSKPWKPSTPKKLVNDISSDASKMRGIVTIPVMKRGQGIKYPAKYQKKMPDQETISKNEEFEIKQRFSNESDISTTALLTGGTDENVCELKSIYQNKIQKYETFKKELNDKKAALIDLGYQAKLPLTNENKTNAAYEMQISNDFMKLTDIPLRLVDTCEQTLQKRKEIIDWLESLSTSESKGIKLRNLVCKIKEFYAENEMIESALDRFKSDLSDEMARFSEMLSKSIRDTMSLQVYNEELTYKLSELRSQNSGLRKQLQTTESLRPQGTKAKLEELDKELKEEKSKLLRINDRLKRAEGQTKMEKERAGQLECALKQAQNQTWNLERTVQSLQEQNQILQARYDQELLMLSESIKTNSTNLDEIAKARDKLQQEKVDLEKRLLFLSENYKESIQNEKNESQSLMTKLFEAERRYIEEVDERKKLEAKVESLESEALETEKRMKDILIAVNKKDADLANLPALQSELEEIREKFTKSQVEIEDYKNKLVQQSEILMDVEQNVNETIKLEETLRSELRIKEKFIDDLENKQSLLIKQLQESESKMESYEKQLSSLKDHIKELREDFGEFDNLNELHDMLKQQRFKLLEATRQNGELAEELQKKDSEIEHHVESLKEQHHVIKQKDDIIKLLSDKEDEQANIIKLLKNKLETRVNIDNELHRKLNDRDTEFEALISTLENKKMKITQLEHIIKSLEDKLHNESLFRLKENENLTELRKKLREYESYFLEAQQSVESPKQNIDTLIKLLEEELESSSQHHTSNKEDYVIKKTHAGDSENPNLLEKYKFQRTNKTPVERNETQRCNNKPTKIVMGNFVKKTYIATNDEKFTTLKVGRSNDSQYQVNSAPEANYKETNLASYTRFPNQYRDEKHNKMLKIAGHKL